MKTMNPDFMKKAISMAKKSGKDIPVGAVIVKDGKIIAKAVNEKEKKQNAIYHAEMIAIKKASKKLGSWRLHDCEMYVTLEPCPMCASAILQSRLKSIYFGSYDLLNGAFGSKSDMCKIMGYNIEIKGGILEKECTDIIKDYFENMRK